MLYEVTISGTDVHYEDDSDKDSVYYATDTYMFTWEGTDIIQVMMSVQAKVDFLNEKLRDKHPDNMKGGYHIEGVCLTQLIRFGDTWIKEFVEQGIITRNYEDQQG